MAESRYEDCEALKDGGHEYSGIRLPTENPPRPDDRFHTVMTGDRIDVLAHRYFGDANLWWVICDCNSIAFSLEIPTGTILRIPSSTSIQMP